MPLSGQAVGELARQVSLVLRINNYIEDVVEATQDLKRTQRDLAKISLAPVLKEISAYKKSVLDLLERCDSSHPDFDASTLSEGFEALSNGDR